MINYVFLKTKEISFILFVVLAITGCSFLGRPMVKSNQNSRREYVNRHRELTSEIREAIIEAKIIKGMTKDEVIASWGEPSKINKPFTNQFGNYYGETWEYNRLLAIPIFIDFENDIVESVNDSLK